MEVLRGQPATLRVDFGTVLDATPTVVVVNANGGSAPGVGAVVSVGGGVYTTTLGAQSALTELRATWSGLLSGAAIESTTVHEVVGSLLFSIAQARATTITGAQTPLSDPLVYPDHAIERVREQVTTQFERRTGLPWTQRHCRGVASAMGSFWLSLHDAHPRTSTGETLDRDGRHFRIARVTSITADGVAVDPANVVIEGSRLRRIDDVWPAYDLDNFHNIILEWEYGPAPADPEAHTHGLAMAMANLVPSDISGYATRFVGQDGEVTFGPGGLAYPTRVWEWISKYHPAVYS